MDDIIQIFGTHIKLPPPPPSELISGYGEEKQKWQRQELPEFFENVEYDKARGVYKLTQEQEDYAREEVRRCKQGFFFYNNGKITFVTGNHYFYLQYWKLEDDIFPDFRNVDREYFLFLDHWKKVKWCLGIVRGKMRRLGASSQATANLIYECIFYKNTNAGLISKSHLDSRDTFTDMVAFGYRQLPVFLKPKQLNKEDSVTELVFAHKSVSPKDGKASVIQDESSYRSKVNFRAPVLNAYDRGRLSYGLFDEFGKLESEIPADHLFSIVKKTLVKGVKRVGFCEMPSTVNSWRKGGIAFKRIWEGANQFAKVGNVTVNRLVKYLSPAYDGYEGFIDEYGHSVIDAPTEEQFKYLCEKWVEKDEYTGDVTSELSEEDIRLGAKIYVTIKRRAGLLGTDLEEEIRQSPCNEEEMFMAANADCSFDALAITGRLNYLKDNQVYKRSVVFYRELDGTVKWRDATKSEESFCWKITWFPPEGQQNKQRKGGLFFVPDNILDGAIAVDSYSNTQGGRKYGSKASALIGRKFDILDPQNSGKAIGQLYGRPTEKDDLHYQVMLAGIFFGYKTWYEHTADDYFGYFKDRGMLNYLGIYPMNLVDPTKKETTDRHKGTPITGFSLSKQMDYAIAYFKHHCNLIDFETILENALIFDPYKRTEFDTMVSFLILLACLQQPVYLPTPPKEPLIKMYGNQNNGKYKNPALADY